MIGADINVIDYAESMGPSGPVEYWRRFRGWVRLEVEALQRAGRGHLQVRRAGELVVLLGMNIEDRAVSSELVAQALEAALSGPAGAVADGMYTYYLTRLLDRLTADESFDRDRVARLEWAYLPVLRCASTRHTPVAAAS